MKLEHIIAACIAAIGALPTYLSRMIECHAPGVLPMDEKEPAVTERIVSPVPSSVLSLPLPESQPSERDERESSNVSVLPSDTTQVQDFAALCEQYFWDASWDCPEFNLNASLGHL